MGRIVEEIRHARPGFVLNNLVGTSSYEFLAAMRALGAEDAAFAPERCPILSCNLTEAELPAIGAAAEGLVAAGPYFRDGAGFASSIEAAAFAAVRELARLLQGRDEATGLAGLLGPGAGGMIDRATHHTALPVVIGRVEGGVFRAVKTLPAVAGDPYLTRPRVEAAPRLRVVS